jgi:hypothetical protein
LTLVLRFFAIQPIKFIEIIADVIWTSKVNKICDIPIFPGEEFLPQTFTSAVHQKTCNIVIIFRALGQSGIL